MPVYESHAPGTFCYIELATNDPQAAGSFYQDLFGWGRKDEDIGEYGVYTQFTLAGEVTGAMYKLTPEQEKQGTRPYWGQYLAVTDADAATEKAKSLGGTIIMEPADVSDYGRMSVIADPAGAVVCLWQTKTRCGLGRRDEKGTICWSELMTGDVEAAARFYADLLGWSPHTTDMAGRDYTVCYNNGRPAGGILARPADHEDIPGHWLLYIAVDDCDACVDQAVTLGATPLVPARDLPNVGRFAVLQDPQGAAFGVVRLLGEKTD